MLMLLDGEGKAGDLRRHANLTLELGYFPVAHNYEERGQR
jgi:hypothetical protein